MHATAPSYPRQRVRINISTEAILTATILAMMLVGAVYLASEIHAHTRQTDQQALAGGAGGR